MLAILAAISIVAYNGVQVRARDALRENDISLITKSLEMYYIDNGHFPSSFNGGSLINNGWTTSVEDGPWQSLASHLSEYTDTLPVDPRNTFTHGVHSATHLDTEFHYAYFATANSFCGLSNPNWDDVRFRPQMFMLVYQYEGREQKTILSGDCTVNPLRYDHASYVRTVR